MGGSEDITHVVRASLSRYGLVTTVPEIVHYTCNRKVKFS